MLKFLGSIDLQQTKEQTIAHYRVPPPHYLLLPRRASPTCPPRLSFLATNKFVLVSLTAAFELNSIKICITVFEKSLSFFCFLLKILS